MSKVIRFVTLLFMTLVVVSAFAQAHGGGGGGGSDNGDWSITYSSVGTGSYTLYGQTHPLSWVNNSFSFGPLNYYAPMRTQASGTITATLAWQGTGAAPAEQWIVVNVNAVSYKGSQNLSNIVSDGWGDAAIDSWDRTTASGNHLRKLKLSQGTGSVTYSLSGVSDILGGGTGSGLQLSMTVTPVPFGVVMTRGAGKAPVVSDDGLTYTADTSFSGMTLIDSLLDPNFKKNAQTITATPSGFSIADFILFSVYSNPADTWDYNTISSTNGAPITASPLMPNFVPSDGIWRITASLQDITQGASYNGAWIWKVHDAYENFVQTGTGSDPDVVVQHIGPFLHIAGELTTVSANLSDTFTVSGSLTWKSAIGLSIGMDIPGFGIRATASTEIATAVASTKSFTQGFTVTQSFTVPPSAASGYYDAQIVWREPFKKGTFDLWTYGGDLYPQVPCEIRDPNLGGLFLAGPSKVS